MDRYTVITLIASALLSTFAYVSANAKPKVDYINFEKAMVITAQPKVEVITFKKALVITASSKN